MRIAQIATVSAPVLEDSPESVESLVWLLTRELVHLGHEVTVFGLAGSEACGDVVETLQGTYGMNGSPDDWQLCEWLNLCKAVEQSHRFDIVHSHAYLWGIPLEPLSRAPMLHTLHVTPYQDHARLWRQAPHARVAALSHYQWSGYPDLDPAGVTYHGIDPDRFTIRPEPEDYICYAGRFIPDKGPLHAIRVARELGIRLKLAGHRNAYYRECIEPLVDGTAVQYVGYVRGPEKDRFFGGAQALLYPVQDPEPFGLVLVEAMMCGTPVVAISLGAVPEIVDEGVTGYCVESTDDLVAATLRSNQLNRLRVRARAESRFAAARMAREYVDLYGSMISTTRGDAK